MNNTDQPYFLSTRLYNSLLRGSQAQTYSEREYQPYPDTPHLLNPAIIRRALADGSLYGWRNIGPKSVAEIKLWLADQPTLPPTRPTEETMTDPTVTDIITSLTRCGFIADPNYFDTQNVQTQVNAVVEKIGEVARLLRRHRQAHQTLNILDLNEATADVVTAAVCLFALTAGNRAPAFIAAKLNADDARGWLHSGLSRAQYEHGGQP